MGKELPQGYRLGDYSIERLLTRSGLQTVYLAQKGQSNRPCRLIVFNVDPGGEPWQRFKSDLGQLNALSHPIIAECLEVASSPDGLAYAVWPQPPGEDLGSRLRRGGALTLRESLSLGRQVAAALHAAHRVEVLHRDLTPESIYLVGATPGTASPEYEPVLVYGFGVARLFEGALAGLALVGHPEYMAPEQISGLSLDVGPATDQYALALIIYQALSASQPFRAESVGAALLKVVRSAPEHLRALRPDLPSHVDTAITRGLAKERQARFPDLPRFIGELVADEKLPAALLTLTDPWLGDCTYADEVLSRAVAAGVATPSLGVLLQNLQDSVPEVVEDQSTVPNTMEDVMRLAVPPEKPTEGAASISSVKETSEPIELNLEPLEPTPPAMKAQPVVVARGGTAQASEPHRALGNNLAMRSGETTSTRDLERSLAARSEKDQIHSVILKGDDTLPQPPLLGLARWLPPGLALYAPWIERGLFLGIGLFLGFLFRMLTS